MNNALEPGGPPSPNFFSSWLHLQLVLLLWFYWAHTDWGVSRSCPKHTADSLPHALSDIKGCDVTIVPLKCQRCGRGFCHLIGWRTLFLTGWRTSTAEVEQSLAQPSGLMLSKRRGQHQLLLPASRCGSGWSQQLATTLAFVWDGLPSVVNMLF